MTTNPPKIIAIASFAVAFLGALMIFAPQLVGIDGFSGGYAISFDGLFIAISAAVAGLMHIGLARKLDGILRGEGMLAHWTYAPEFWAEYSDKEYEEEKSEKRVLFLVIYGIALFVGIMFWAYDPEAGFIVFLAMLILIGVIWFTWQFITWYSYRQNKAGGKEAYITKDAVYMNGKLYTWNTVLASMDEVMRKDNQGLQLLSFKYTSVTRTGLQNHTIRVPIPRGQEEDAERVMQQINS